MLITRRGSPAVLMVPPMLITAGGRRRRKSTAGALNHLRNLVTESTAPSLSPQMKHCAKAVEDNDRFRSILTVLFSSDVSYVKSARPVANMNSPVAKMNPPVADISLCPTSFLLHQTPPASNPSKSVRLCQMNVNHYLFIIFHFVSGVKGPKGRAFAHSSSSSSSCFLESSFHDSFKAGFPFVQKLHHLLQSASHGRQRNMIRSCLEFSSCFEWLDPVSLFFKLMVPFFGSV